MSKCTKIKFISKELAIWRQHAFIKTKLFRKKQIRESIQAVENIYKEIPYDWVCKLISLYKIKKKPKLFFLRFLVYALNRLIFLMVLGRFYFKGKLIKYK